MSDRGRSDSDKPRLAWTLRKDGLELAFDFELGGGGILTLGVPPPGIAEEAQYAIELTFGDAESLATALNAWSQA